MRRRREDAIGNHDERACLAEVKECFRIRSSCSQVSSLHEGQGERSAGWTVVEPTPLLSNSTGIYLACNTSSS